MHKQMRRNERSIDRDSAMSIVVNGEYGVLSTVDSENQPYCVPLNYVVLGNDIFFHCAHKGHKIDNILSNPMVSFCVVGKTKVLPEKFTTIYESAIVTGRASIADNKDKKRGLQGLLRKYCPDHMESGDDYISKMFEKTTVIRIIIEEITGKSNDR
ncbi:conserved hypothetical protein [Desulfamplus magnetovallimortis]|uniref:Uncharacterized protein n=1 Tax=Desulfamplus magnetovallimortis TaxID=1246637 RepID=A0A1W1H6T4_9BACT|nr:pyridoxamine 5'-phosphate oxidase family protein [Desulfamplus magnetovallimortis]SLM28200.1 conserved hypothetical protein [Desulfamplus magnetovallimortis]